MTEFGRLPDLAGLGYHPDVSPAGWYWRALDGDGFPAHVVLRCEHGRQATLGAKHGVAADGTVTPSLVWPGAAPCCHVWGRLRAWSPDDAARRSG